MAALFLKIPIFQTNVLFEIYLYIIHLLKKGFYVDANFAIWFFGKFSNGLKIPDNASP